MTFTYLLPTWLVSEVRLAEIWVCVKRELKISTARVAANSLSAPLQVQLKVVDRRPTLSGKAPFLVILSLANQDDSVHNFSLHYLYHLRQVA